MNRRILNRAASLVVAAAVTLPLAACGGGDGGSSSGGAAAPATSLKVVGTEFAFAPQDVSVPAGQDVTVAFQNDGAVDHEWVVLRKGTQIKSEAEFQESMVLSRIDSIPAGASATGSFTFTEAGRYQIICALPGHFAAGMQGKLTVS